jgi:hypothetical protein
MSNTLDVDVASVWVWTVNGRRRLRRWLLGGAVGALSKAEMVGCLKTSHLDLHHVRTVAKVMTVT